MKQSPYRTFCPPTGRPSCDRLKQASLPLVTLSVVVYTVLMATPFGATAIDVVNVALGQERLSSPSDTEDAHQLELMRVYGTIPLP